MKSRSKSYFLSGKWAVKTRGPVAGKKEEHSIGKTRKFGSGERTVVPKASRFYPAEDVKQRKVSNKGNHKAPKIRASLQPGTIVIILAGRFRGKRAIMLKSLESGLILVTGPYKINGVPLRRVNPAYVIGTSTKIDISGVDIDAKFNDAYFKSTTKKTRGNKNDFGDDEMQTEDNEYKVSDERKADQKVIDGKIIGLVKAVPELPEYLNAKFSLQKGQYPHNMKF